LEAEVIDNTARHRFELHEAGQTSFVLYSKTENSVRLIHTEVPPALQGKGVGSRLVRGVLRLAEQEKLTVIPVCPFVVEYLKRHPEHLGLVDPESMRMIQSGDES
jgi:predicted GNAT family acetyltransferase